MRNFPEGKLWRFRKNTFGKMLLIVRRKHYSLCSVKPLTIFHQIPFTMAGKLTFDLKNLLK